MTTLGTFLTNLDTYLASAFSATIYFDVIGEYTDNLPYPFFEITVKVKKDNNFAASTLTDYAIELAYYCNTTNTDKNTFAALEEKLSIDKHIRETLDACWTDLACNQGLGIGPISNINLTYMDSLSNGQTGLPDKKRIRLAIQFDLSMRDV
jgi:hypothetical protein